jgi:hypothetical protein
LIYLHFRRSAKSDSVQVGPAPWYRVAGNFVRQGPHGAIIGTFRKHVWEVGSETFPSYECDQPYKIRFEDSEGGVGPVLGPFTRLRVDDGTMTVDEAQVVAKFMDPTQLWLCYEADTYWPVMVIESVAESV